MVFHPKIHPCMLSHTHRIFPYYSNGSNSCTCTSSVIIMLLYYMYMWFHYRKNVLFEMLERYKKGAGCSGDTLGVSHQNTWCIEKLLKIFSFSMYPVVPYTLAKLAICYCTLHFWWLIPGLSSQYFSFNLLLPSVMVGNIFEKVATRF